MKKYEMYRPNGEKVSVGTMIMALRISGEFKAATELRVEKFADPEPVSDEFYASCDALVARWNHNHKAVEQMKADPEFQEESRRTSYVLSLLQIIDMGPGPISPALACFPCFPVSVTPASRRIRSWIRIQIGSVESKLML